MPINPTADFFNSTGSLEKIASLAPDFYRYLTNPEMFDYTQAPTGIQDFKVKGKNNNFTVDWDAITAPMKKQVADKAAADAATKAASDAAAAQAAQEAAAAKRTANIGTARGYASNAAADAIRQAGLDPTMYQDRINSSLDQYIAGLGDTADPFTSLNGNNIGTQLVAGDTTAARNRYTSEVNTKLGNNYGDKLISDSLLDPIINDILGTQQKSAQDYLDRGKARGIINDTGYNAGLSKLGESASAGRSALTSLGTGVIDKYQTEANSVRDKAYGAASGFTLGSNFNLDDYIGQGNSIAERANANAGGDLRSAVGGTNYFDFSDLMNKAGQAQGAVNLRDNDLLTALSDRKKADQQGRGLGAQGVY